MEFLGYISAMLMGLSLGMIGGGGSILTVPILVYFFKQDGLTATTNSMFIVGSTALMGAVLNFRCGLVDFRTGFLFAIPSFAGVLFTRKAVLPLIPETIQLPAVMGLTLTKPLLILLSFAVLMIFASRAMIKSGRAKSETEKVQHGLASIGLKGFFVGCITGFVGAGGGFLIVPALALLLHLPMRTAIGTSLAIIAGNSLFGFAVSGNHTDWGTLLTIAFLGLVGLIFGHRISPHVPETRLKQGFGYFVLAVGLFVLINQGLKMLGSP